MDAGSDGYAAEDSLVSADGDGVVEASGSDTEVMYFITLLFLNDFQWAELFFYGRL